MNSLNNYQYYCGVNHDVQLFNINDTAQNRHGQYFLTSTNAHPYKRIVRNKPLNVTPRSLPVNQNQADQLFFPKSISAGIEYAPEFNNYDIIIVSSIYCEIASQLCLHLPDYLDRLYVPVSLYSADPQLNSSAYKVGSVGLQKLSFPKAPADYINDLQQGYIPSKASLHECISLYQGQNIDFYTQLALQNIQSFLSTAESASNNLSCYC